MCINNKNEGEKGKKSYYAPSRQITSSVNQGGDTVACIAAFHQPGGDHSGGGINHARIWREMASERYIYQNKNITIARACGAALWRQAAAIMATAIKSCGNNAVR